MAMATIQRWARCPVCEARLHIWTQDTVSKAMLWQGEAVETQRWINEHAHASRATAFRQEMDRWAMGYRETEPQPYERLDEEV